MNWSFAYPKIPSLYKSFHLLLTFGNIQPAGAWSLQSEKWKLSTVTPILIDSRSTSKLWRSSTYTCWPIRTSLRTLWMVAVYICGSPEDQRRMSNFSVNEILFICASFWGSYLLLVQSDGFLTGWKSLPQNYLPVWLSLCQFLIFNQVRNFQEFICITCQLDLRSCQCF